MVGILATVPEVKELRSEALALKEVVADLTLENRLLKKSMIGERLCRRSAYRDITLIKIRDGRAVGR